MAEISEPAPHDEGRPQVTTTQVKTNARCNRSGCAAPQVTIRVRGGSTYTVCTQHGRALLEWVTARNESKWHNEIGRMMRVRYTDLADPKPGTFGAQEWHEMVHIPTGTRVYLSPEMLARIKHANGEVVGADGKRYPAHPAESRKHVQQVAIVHAWHHRGQSLRRIQADLWAELRIRRSVTTLWNWLQTPCDECTTPSDVISTDTTLLAAA
jgi:hypothetical protein